MYKVTNQLIINQSRLKPTRNSSTRLDDISHLSGGHAPGESCIITARFSLGTEPRILTATCADISALPLQEGAPLNTS
jgi:hypothetical protein